MHLDELMIAWFCLIGDLLPLTIGKERLRMFGPEPILAVGLVVRMEVISMYLGFNQDTKLFAYFQGHWSYFFP